MTTELHGKNIVAGEVSQAGSKALYGFDPRRGEQLPEAFYEATIDEVDRAAQLATDACTQLRAGGSAKTIELLRAIADEINSIREAVVNRAAIESGLDTGRLNGECDRTIGQLRMFADLVAEGSWVDAIIDTAIPDRKPLPRPDLRRMLGPIGPVAVFGASNFPLAFSVAGGDTASALAAGNPVIVKAHPAHPGTSEMVGAAIQKAVRKTGLPGGTFSLLHGANPSVSLALVSHPAIKAVGFTGSARAGRALFDAAGQRPDPIPVYAEMGSVNPVFVLSDTLKEKAPVIAEGLFKSVTLGVGQFCTSPGIVAAIEGDGFRQFRSALQEHFEAAAPATMLYPGIQKAYEQKLTAAASVGGVTKHTAHKASVAQQTEAAPSLLITTASAWADNEALQGEIFGPATVAVACGSREELLQMARSLEGTLTATIFGTTGDLEANRDLIDILTTKAGRLIFNGFPTGVEVGHAMHHGGPFPATSDSKFTSVGSTAIYRFAKPVCYQNFPATSLPTELQDDNSRGILRKVNGNYTRDVLKSASN